MKIILTKHCLQRREHYQVEDPRVVENAFKECLLDKTSMYYCDLDDGKYKLYHNYFCCVFTKKSDKYTIITIRGHKKLLDKNDIQKVKLKLANSAFKSTGGFIIRRYNYIGNVVKCGYIINIVGTEQRLLVLNKNLHKKYNMSGATWVPKVGLKFSTDDEIMDLVTFNESEKCYYLNKFDRI